jgi:inorganic triphosphatase YgiF
MAIEVEAKLRADGPEILAALASRPTLGVASLGPAATAAEVDRYLDTDEGALAAARWACRLRERDGRVRVSLKGPPEAPTTETGVHRRPEVEGPANEIPDPSAWPASQARDLLTELAEGAPLRERLRLRQQRTERAVTLDGAALGTLTLDVVAIEAGGRSGGVLHVVELEMHPSCTDEAAFAEAAADLARTPGLTPEPMTKLEHALERLAGP